MFVNAPIRGVVVSAGTNDLGSLLLEESIQMLDRLARQLEEAGVEFVFLLTPNLSNINCHLEAHYRCLPFPSSKLRESDDIHLSTEGAIRTAESIMDFFQIEQD
jgi:lysophospholipase L1-like esterase